MLLRAVAPQQGPAGKKVWGVCLGSLPWRVSGCLGAPVIRRLHAPLVRYCSSLCVHPSHHILPTLLNGRPGWVVHP